MFETFLLVCFYCDLVTFGPLKLSYSQRRFKVMQCPRTEAVDSNWGALEFAWQLWQTYGKSADVLQSDWCL